MPLPDTAAGPPPARPGRLFRKLMLAFWTTTMLFFFFGMAVRLLLGKPVPEDFHPWLLLFPVLSGLVASLGAGLLMAWYLSRPLHWLRWGLDELAAGRLHTRVRPRLGNRDDEIVDVAQHLDDMAERLERLTTSRTRLLHDVSHELRSPLTRLRAAIGLARQAPAETPAMIERIDREAERLNELIDAMLTLHRLEAGATPPGALQRVDLIELLDGIARDAQFEAQSAGKALHWRAEGRCVVEVDGELIYRAFENVVRNAVKFTAAGTAVELEARVVDGALHVLVADRGPGVAGPLQAALFEPFVRGESARPGTGFGLGLAIAQRALLAHGGDITPTTRPGGGLVMALRLPAAGA